MVLWRFTRYSLVTRSGLVVPILKCFTGYSLATLSCSNASLATLYKKATPKDSKADAPQMLHWLYFRESQSLWRFTGYTIAMHRSLAIDGGSNAMKTQGF